MKSSFHQRNRESLREALQAPAIVLAGYAALQRSGDASFAFEQEANFWYLTGVDAPGWQLIMAGNDEWLIAPEVSAVSQLFDGSLSWERARAISGVEKIMTQKEGAHLLTDLARKYSVVGALGPDPRAKHYDFTLNPAPVKLHRQLKKAFREVVDCRPALAKLRAIKQPEEIAAIQAAVDLTAEAFQSVRSQILAYEHEYQVEADFTRYFRHAGGRGHAYDPIIAAGGNACTLHYTANDRPLQEDAQLLLMDVGARVGGYAADITRTYALGRPTKRQAAVHKAVEAAHHRIIGLLRPGLPVPQYIEEVDRIMQAALSELGLLTKASDYRRYFPHAVSHGLGIDVHDSLGQPETFLPGMVLTVEPGIYIPEEGIGVRIEDDILITGDGARNLSAALPTGL